MHEDGDLSHYVDVATNIDYPDADTLKLSDVEVPHPPLTLDNTDAPTMWDVSLEEVVKGGNGQQQGDAKPGRPILECGLQCPSPGGEAPDAVINNADASRTVYDPAITETTPFTGVEYALAAFNAQLSSSFAFQKNRPPAKRLAGGCRIQLRHDLHGKQCSR